MDVKLDDYVPAWRLGVALRFVQQFDAEAFTQACLRRDAALLRRERGPMLKTFAYHRPSEQGLAAIQELREAFSVVHEKMMAVCPQSREKSTAFTRLEEAAMWAIKAVVFNDPASDVGDAVKP